jgi:hypothetical protein
MRASLMGVANEMTFGCLTAPVYNIVSLENTDLIQEMISHFCSFWSTPLAAQLSIQRIQHSVDSRAKHVLQVLDDAHPASSPELIKEFNALMIQVQKSTDELAAKLHTLKIEDFVFGFHPAPDASIGHLHMHVLPAPVEFRHFSTDVHDWKTVPTKAVMEVIREEIFRNKL